ncbi:MAG: Type 1 glutamine amidotransferase-like domain-containing protein [Acidobacteria bacterium]|nr:Type 1 glutamine amidotransferase-like domain-containing protein [Acidobacteriota bacterium]
MTKLRVELAVPVHELVLIGGGEFSFGETREIDEYLLSKLHPERRKIAFLPTASGSAEYAGHIGKYFRELDPRVETINVPLYRGRDNRRLKILNMILGAGLIYIGGGVTNNLLENLRESAAEIALRDAASNDVIIAAIGAAASSFGTHARDMRAHAASLPALGWLAHTVVDAGFDPENDVTLRRLMSIPETRLGLGIPAGTALAIRSDGSTTVVGGGNIAAFRKA